MEAMRARGHEVPSSCESGTCGTCRTKLLAGEADHRDLVLAEHERGNQIMICVSRGRSPISSLTGKAMSARQLRMGVAGLGRAFTIMVPTLANDPRVRLVAGADPLPEGRRLFASQFGARTYATVEELCADPDVEVVYVATPHSIMLRMRNSRPNAENMCWSKSRWRFRFPNAIR
jgi:hypothetical protein